MRACEIKARRLPFLSSSHRLSTSQQIHRTLTSVAAWHVCYILLSFSFQDVSQLRCALHPTLKLFSCERSDPGSTMEQTTRMCMRIKDIDTSSPQDIPISTPLGTSNQGYATSCDGSGSARHWQFGSISMNLPLQTDVETPPTDVFLPSTLPRDPPQRPDLVTSPPSTSICFGSVQAQHLTPFTRENEARCEVLDASPLDLSGAKIPVSCAARVIEDINSIMYPDGVQRPSVKLKKYSKQCMFRYELMCCTMKYSDLEFSSAWDLPTETTPWDLDSTEVEPQRFLLPRMSLARCPQTDRRLPASLWPPLHILCHPRFPPLVSSRTSTLSCTPMAFNARVSSSTNIRSGESSGMWCRVAP